ncbi:MAG: hypothetical protein JNL80_09390 [Phycisphaerae bacterium]|jgi:hypothetical protein|nr:hypothetical protein [Phycisphaerae bacterium]
MSVRRCVQSSRPFRLAVAGLAAATVASTLSADLVKAIYVNSTAYHYKVNHMPDLDQKRLFELAGDGSMHCVPTSTINLFAYAANHGFPFFAPGPANWQSQSKYDAATDAIHDLGVLMGTTVANGTSGANWMNGAQEWLNDYGAGLLAQQHFWNTSTYTVTAAKMAAAGAQGGIVAFAYGRYNITGEFLGLPLIARDGGHAVTLNEAYRVGSDKYLRYRDPADDGYNSTQSTFVSKEVEPVNFLYATAPFPGAIGTNTAIAYPSDDGKVRLLDQFMVLRPIYFLSFVNTGNQWTLSPTSLGSLGGAIQPVTLNAPAFGISDLMQDADGVESLVLVNTSAAAGLTQLRRVDHTSGEQIAVGSFNSLKRFTVGRDGRIYAHDGDKLYCLAPDGTLESATSSIPAPTALAYDDVNDHILLLSIPERRIQRLTKSFAQVSLFNVPTGTPMAGDGSVIVNPLDGAVYFTSDGTNSIGRLLGSGPNPTYSLLSIPGIVNPKGISAGDDGALYISSSGLMKVARLNRAGGWSIDPTSPFHNLPAASRIAMLRSRSNFDPALHSGPAWDNIDADNLLPIGVEVADCLGDLDNDNDTDAADIARLLGNWGTSDPNSDLNADGTVGAPDLAILLGGWGACS